MWTVMAFAKNERRTMLEKRSGLGAAWLKETLKLVWLKQC